MRKIVSSIMVVLLVISFFPGQSFAAETQETEFLQVDLVPCQEDGARITCSDINKMLTESAIERGIPPEVAKAIAFQESTWRQWTDAKQTIPNVQDDGGIGIMQVTDKGYDEERLKKDIQYNIDTGLDILNEKWELGVEGYIPTINDNSRDVIEHWYFAVLAYNGLVEKNSPLFKSDGSPNTKAYQEEVFNRIELDNNNIKLVNLPFTREDFKYEHGDDSVILEFNKKHYQVPGPLTKSRQLFSNGDKVYTVTGTVLRDAIAGGKGTALSKRHVAEIIDSTIYYDTSSQSPERHWVRYKVKLDDNRTGYVASGTIEPITSRLSGSTRFDTAIEISKSGWQEGANTVVLAKGFDFPDALAGAPLASKYDAPILLTHTDKLTASTKKEIKRLGANKVIILGSTGAVSKAVENELRTTVKEVRRIGGVDRFETAQLIAKELGSKTGKAIVATGFNYPDALAVGPYAAQNGVPILLTRADRIPNPTKQALNGISTIYVIGGTGAVSNKVVNQLPGKVTRISGKDRFETASAIIKNFNFGDQQALVATGYNFADALTGAVLAADKNAPLLLVRDGKVTEPIESTIAQRKIREFILLGGKNAVNVDNELAKLAVKNIR
ncbi:cell wall-binding repeat-containing protein [Bacillus timonensis]|uniref:cell wall-binding repeat-containing protein n=1 Tax=Bacillus timonensis TaxID=1033734 RepID=UPI0002886AE2|nr:cell wall-binding repeat-containing protein [Bacillus timonensis]